MEPWLTISLLSTTSMNDFHIIKAKQLWIVTHAFISSQNILIKAKSKIVFEYVRKNLFKRQISFLKCIKHQWTLNNNIFGHSATTIGGVWVSLNYPILNFKKTVCPKSVWSLNVALKWLNLTLLMWNSPQINKLKPITKNATEVIFIS